MADPFAFFRSLKYGSYTRSKKARVYEQIARDKGTTAQTVYEIAHGRKVKTDAQRDIREILINIGIMQHI